MDAQIESPQSASAATNNSILGWLRINLSVTLALISIASGIAGALISGTLRVAATDYRLSDVTRITNEHQKQIDQFHSDMIDVDRRLNSGVTYTNDVRRTEDSHISGLQERIAVLEAQLRFLADRTPVPSIGNKR